MDAHDDSFYVWIEGWVEERLLGGSLGEEEGLGVTQGGEPEGEAVFTAVEDVGRSHCCFFCREDEFPEAADALGY